MRYVVKAKQVFVLVPSPMVMNGRQVSEQGMFYRGTTLPDGVKPHVIQNLLDQDMIEEVA